MSEASPLSVKKCGNPIGYVTVTTKNSIAAKPFVDNIKLVTTFMDYSSKNSVYRRNF